ncbi:MAG: 1-acyl-sn-glycerol-3-phosphate acyltransferase [Pseudomonadota bacterium]
MSKQAALPGKISMFFRSLIFVTVLPVFTIFYSMICVASYPLPLRYRFAIVMGWSRSAVWLLKVICHIDYQETGLENIPRDRCGIIMSKHQSSWETFYLPPQFHETAIILKRELCWVPFFGWGMAAIDPIAINRSEGSSAMTQVMKQGKECLVQGRWILVFPEGTRIAPGHVGKYKLGGARLAVDTGSPIIPVAHNAGTYWSKRKFIKRPGTIKVVFGPVIETVGRTAEAVLEETKSWIESTMLKIDGA